MKVTTKNYRHCNGFTLLETVVVIAILAILAGMIKPLTGRVKLRETELTVRGELKEIASSLQNYYYEYGCFPSSLTNTGFLGPFLFPGVDNAAITDDFKPGSNYAMPFTLPDCSMSYPITYGRYIASAGPDRTADIDNWCTYEEPSTCCNPSVDVFTEYGYDDFYMLVQGQIPLRRRARLKLNIIGAALGRFLFDAGTTHALTGTWQSGAPTSGGDLWTMMLMDEYKYIPVSASGAEFVGMSSLCFRSSTSLTKPMVYSYGPDCADDSGSDDDITF